MSTNPFPRGLHWLCSFALLCIAMTLSAAAQSRLPGASAGVDHGQATLQLRVEVVPVAASLPHAHAAPISNFAGVVYNFPGDSLLMSVTEEVRPLRHSDIASKSSSSRAADGILKTVTVVLR